MFPALKAEIVRRILNTEIFFNAMHTGASIGSYPAGSAAARGLVFVDLYGTYEYTVKTAVEAAVGELKKRGTPIKDIRLQLLSLILHPECDSAADANVENMW